MSEVQHDQVEEFNGPGHGNHWEVLYDLERVVSEILVRDMQDGTLIDQHPCVDVVEGTDRTEQVACLRWGGERIAHDTLVVSCAMDGSSHLFSGYPVFLDGIRHVVELEHFTPWPYGIEAWVHGRVTAAAVPLCFFDTHYYAGSTVYQPGQKLDVSLAALAYSMQPIQLRKFEIKEGPFWEMERQQRLENGESEVEASRPVSIHMTGAAIFLPRFDDVAPDEAEYQGVIDAVEAIEHDGQLVYRVEIDVMRPEGETFHLPVYVSERVLDGYVPQLGEDVQGTLWLQGRILGVKE